MKLTEKVVDLSKLALSEEQGASRSAGIHVSQVIRHIALTAGLRKDSGFSEDDLNQFAMIGRLWERVLADAYYTKPRYERIGEIELEGIIGSPDAVDTEEWAIEEMKVCWMSAKNFTERPKFREYLWQGKAYCQMSGMCRCRFTVLHIRGDYTTGVPIPMEYSCLFTPGELKDNWQMIRNGAKELVSHGS